MLQTHCWVGTLELFSRCRAQTATCTGSERQTKEGGPVDKLERELSSRRQDTGTGEPQWEETDAVDARMRVCNTHSFGSFRRDLLIVFGLREGAL